MQPSLKTILFIALLSIAAPAAAQDATTQAAQQTAEANKNNTAYVLKPEGCDFQITLPGEPYNTRRCDPENPDNCSRIITYTKTFGLDATVNFQVSCNPADPDTFGKFSTDVMNTTLLAMLGTDKLEEMKSDVYETEHFKQAMMVGTSKIADNDRLYTAQLWIGHNSIFTVEGEVIGFAGEEADRMFAEVISSARPVDEAALKAPEKTAADKDEEKPADKDEDKDEEKAEEKAEPAPAADQKKP